LLTTDAPGLARPCLLQSSRSDIWNMVRNVYRVLSHSHVVMGIATPTKEASATTYPTMKSILNLVYLIFVYRNVMYIACIQYWKTICHGFSTKKKHTYWSQFN
jgi:hypothetical protein